MNVHRRLNAVLIATGAIAVVLACGQANKGGAGTAINPPPPSQGQLAVELTDAPNPAVDELWVVITKVTVHSTTDGWQTVSDPTKMPLTVNLLSLQSSATAPLGFLNLPKDTTITQIRLYVAQDGNYVVTGGTHVPLKVPSGSESGIKITGPWTIGECQQTLVTLDFDGKKSIWYHPEASGWILRPVIHNKKSATVAVACAPPPDAGTDGGSTTPVACDATHACPAGYACGSAGVCLGVPGTSCAALAECITSTCDATNRCAAAPVGGSCSYCITDTCSGGTCAQGGANAPCGGNGDCISNSCTEGSCTAPTTAGGAGSPCTAATATTSCFSGVCNVDNTCAQGGPDTPCSAAPAQDCAEGLACNATTSVPGSGTCVSTAG